MSLSPVMHYRKVFGINELKTIKTVVAGAAGANCGAANLTHSVLLSEQHQVLFPLILVCLASGYALSTPVPNVTPGPTLFSADTPIPIHIL